MPEVIDNLKVGAFIKELLKNHHMTQEALANHLMISKSAVSQNLNGKSSFDIQNLMSIAKLFNMSLDDLLNCRISEESDIHMSEYMRFASKELDEIKQYKAQDLHIQNPDIYGKVLIDYVIDQDLEELFVYLDRENVTFVKPYYHRAKEIYLKIIIYMLRKKRQGIIKYIKAYAMINQSFDIAQEYYGLEVWQLIDSTADIDLIKALMTLTIEQPYTTLGIKRNREVKVISRESWPEIIAMYKLHHVLDVYLKYVASADDFYQFSATMLLYEFSEGVLAFVNYFFKETPKDIQKSYFQFQKTVHLIISKNQQSLFEIFVEKGIYESLTQAIILAINEKHPKMYEFCLKSSEQTILNDLDYMKIGLAAVQKSDICILELIKNQLEQKHLNYLLSEVKTDDVQMLYYLVSLGARFDFKYYNSNTMTHANLMISYLMKKDVKQDAFYRRKY